MALLTLINLAGSIALLLWGVHMVQTGVQRACGARLNSLLARMLGNRFQAFLTGLGITAILQSSTATGLMITGLAGRGQLELAPALAVMLGANVGTTLIVQLLSFDVSSIAPAFVLTGVMLFRRSQGAWRDSGRAFIGLGLILISLRQFLVLLGPYTHKAEFTAVLASMGSHDIAAILLGAVITWLSHSSVATVMLVSTFATSNTITPETALALILGANIGTSINPVMEGNRTSPIARRISMGNLLVRIVGACMLLPVLPWISTLITRLEPDAARQVANFHTLFNVGLAVIMLPALKIYTRLMEKLIPDIPDDKKQSPGTPRYLDTLLLDKAPQLAIGSAAREAMRLCDLLVTMLATMGEGMNTTDPSRAASARPLGNAIEDLGASIRSYLAGLDPETASEPEMEAAEEILAFCNQLLHAEDIVERSLVPMVQKMARQRISLPPSLQVPVQKMMDQLARNLNICATVLLRQNTSETNPLAGQKDFFRTLESTATAAYFERLRKQPGDSNSSAEYNLREEVVTYQLTLLRDLRRVNTHIVAAASYSLPTGED
ncbi:MULTISPECIES: Na/Pi cotransporter family protein [Acetobacter]|uniref:Na/Pi cotransporter family protein n=1 Tax=Acetobacter thailandicus TaxID=1502842 RepID=A0ABT3QGS2_9PROT|nr:MULTISPECIES: Na/Pi cotransporter family protein [Acetobacter]MBS0960752.1 Na/Pi cotransporter family protein [Acetobacter thailandicus]MBS1004407.1 Na/Pi cotransporter family protein [Acetobacter thailandicus]MCX2564477.1 Na/Pi cotransporter family protein [Acetobacter thailandicus]